LLHFDHRDISREAATHDSLATALARQLKAKAVERASLARPMVSREKSRGMSFSIFYAL
jgi:hypothetical protein